MNTNSYFTVELLTAGTLGLHANGAECIPVTMYYWINKDPNSNRDNYDGTITSTSSVTYIPNLNSGDKIKFYRAETTALGSVENASSPWNNRFTGTAYVKLSGNLASLIGFSETLPPGAFRYFLYNYRCKDASELEFPWENVSSSYCFCRMFQNNISLTKAPKLKADNISSNCYQWMFLNCSSLVEVTCLCKTKNSNSTSSWLDGVASTGTFIKHPDATWSEGKSGIPTGWSVKNMNPQTQTIDYNNITAAYVRGNISLSAIYGRGNVLLWGTPVNDYASKYFTVKILTSDSGRLYYRCDSGYEWTVEYSKNNGNWISLTANQSYGIGISNYISVEVGDEIRFRKTGTSSSTVANSYLWSNTCTFEAYGNIMSLAYGDNFIGQTTIPGESYFRQFFANNESLGAVNTYLKSVDNLVMPATTLTNWCYANMFYNCNAITIGPTILPATTLQNYCYYSMFTGCSSLTKAPILPATTLVSGCYDSMFANNTSLQYIKAMFTTDPGGEQYNGPCANWVLNVPSGGTFVKNSAATWNRTGANAVPSGWTIEYA